MSSEAVDLDGTNILPIPPKLEFPFPQESNVSSTTPSLRNTGASSTTANESPLGQGISPAANSRSPTTPDLFNADLNQSRPGIVRRRFVTERPAAAQRASVLRIKRRQTGHITNPLHTAAWNSDSDSLSSSSEDEAPRKTRARRSSKLPTKPPKKTKSDPQADKSKDGSRERGFGKFSVGNDNYKTRGKVSKRDGRLNISINETAGRGYLAKALGATLQHHFPGRHSGDEARPIPPLRPEDPVVRPNASRSSTASTSSTAMSVYDKSPPPILNIVIMVIGSRGDIQPFLRLGKLLKEEHGHRVRIATHPAFKNFVEQDSGLEFFSVGGDPAEIMAFMVKNPGLIPKIETVKAGEIGRRRDSMFEMFQGFWRACINATDDEKDVANLKMMGDRHPFVADAIIANPPSFAHVHCAERLGIPLHLMFTFPNSPTQQFPHPLTNIKQSNVDSSYTNFMSYPLVEMLIWQGLGDLVNRFRVHTLGLEPVSTLWAPGQLFRQKVPYSYLWSPGLIPKPLDWGPEIDIVGYVFLDLASNYHPPKELTEFLEAGEPPVYIGFGSIVVDDPDKFTAKIFEAVKLAGVRALVSKGWGGLGDEGHTPDNIYMLENTPHDWLFPRVSAVVHHGGAGSTAAGLKCGKPTLIVPFFADQPFWGAMVAKAGAGAEPLPYKYLTAEKLAEGIKFLLTPEAKTHAEEIAKGIADEGDGAANAVKSFHRSLPLRGENSLRCSILDNHVAVWELKATHVRLSALAAEILVVKKKIKWQDLRLLRHCAWNDFNGPGEPLSGSGGALLNTTAGVVKGVGGMPFRWAKSMKKREKHLQKRKERQSMDQGSHPTHGDSLGMNGHAKQPGGERPSGQAMNGGHHSRKSKHQNGDLDHDFQGIGKMKYGPDGQPQSPLRGANILEDNESAVSDGTDGSDENIAQNLAEDTGRGFAEAGEALAKAPMDLSMAIAQGFHNAPRLYGDTTVRKPTRISGIQSGLRAAGEEFVYGIYDGWTGLVKHPYQGAKEDGALGFVKGVGKGLGGFVLKDLAAIIGPFGYTLKGIHKEMIKGRQPTAFIRRARIIQGHKDLYGLDEDKRKETIDEVGQGWRVIMNVRKDFAEIKNHGLKGRIVMHKERQYWRKHGAFENVEQASRALEARKEGRDFDEVFEQQMYELKKAQGPRKSTMSHRQRHETSSKGKKRDPVAKKVRKVSTALTGGNTGTDVGDKVAVDGQGGQGVNEPTMGREEIVDAVQKLSGGIEGEKRRLSV